MARSPAITPQLILPDPPERYSVEDQRALRRALRSGVQQTIDFETIVSQPQPIEAIASLPEIAPYILTLLDDTSAAQARATLDITQHQSAQVITTASLADGATELGLLPIPDKECDLLSIEVDRKCWVTLYVTSAARAADSLRALPTRPTAGTGVLAEFVATVAGTINCGPIPRLANGDGTGGSASVNRVYYRIVNQSGSPHTVTVTFHFGALP